MHIITLLLCLLILTGCAVGWGKPSEVRYFKLSSSEYQIVVDGDPLLVTMGGLVERFQQKARTICSNYEILSLTQYTGHAGAYSASLSNVTGTIKCK